MGVGSLVTGKVTNIPAVFNATIIGNQMTQVGVVTSGNVCIGATLTGSGNSVITTTSAVINYGVLIVANAPVGGPILIGMILSGVGIIGTPSIASQLSGVTGGIGNYQLSAGYQYLNNPSTTITGTLAYTINGTQQLLT